MTRFITNENFVQRMIYLRHFFIFGDSVSNLNWWDGMGYQGGCNDNFLFFLEFTKTKVMIEKYDYVALEYGLKSFQRLSNAISYMGKENILRRSEGKEELQIFAREYGLSRKRWFVVCTVSSFFARYKEMPEIYRS